MNDDGKGKRMDSILKSIGRGEILFRWRKTRKSCTT